MKRIVYAVPLLVLLLVSFMGGVWYNQRGAGIDTETRGGRKVLYYVDPMNPSHTSDRPGAAPCGMAMEPVYADDETIDAGSAAGCLPPGTARISPERQQMIGIRVESVKETPQSHTLRALGRVSADENRTYRILGGADGWVWSIFDSTTGSLVEKDQLMATVYNYQFLAREQQYLYALDFADRRRQAGTQNPSALQPGARENLGALPVEQVAQNVPTAPSGLNPTGNVYYIEDQVLLAKLELYNLGAGDYQLKEIARTRKVTTELEVRAPTAGIVLSRNVTPMQRFDKGAELFQIADLSKVWVLADVFEGEARRIRPGETARVSLPRQKREFQAKVTEVPPRFDRTDRTLKVRLEVDNPDLELRPEMFVDVDFSIPLPLSINVPVDAVLDSGLTQTVFIDLGNGYFEPRTVKTGWRFGGRVEILEGLMPGEKIVVSGNFLINSESRMKLAAAGLSGTPEKDPVCGMPVYPAKAKKEGLTSEWGGRAYYFCSEECKTKFDGEHGGHQMKMDAAGSESHDASSAEPVKIPNGIAKCPVCGMIVHESTAVAAGMTSDYQGKNFYFCTKYCKEHFDNMPAHYSEKATRNEHRHTAPDHAEHDHD